MTRRSMRELEHKIDRVEQSPLSDDTHRDVTVVWREADPEARPDGMEWDADEPRITYDLWSAQREALDRIEDDAPDVTAFMAGYGSGKTIFGARWLLAQALEYDGSRFLALGQSFSEARPTTFKTLFGQLPGDRTAIVTSGHNGPEQSPIVADYNRSEHRLTLTNDTEIVCGSADKWSRYAGLEVGGAWLDEPSHYGSELYDLLEMLGGRLRGVDGPKQQLWTLTGAGYNAAYDILEEREDRNGEPIGLDIDIVRASTLDNPYLAEGDIERFKRQYKGTAREEQALHGGFTAGTGLVYATFDPDVHVIPYERATELAVDDDRLYGYDAGFRHARVLLEAGRTDGGRLVILDEFYRHETHVDDAIAWVQTKPQGIIHAEHEPTDIERFNRAGWRAKRANKSLDAGIAEVRRLLSPDPDTGRVGLLIADRCENLIREFQGYKEEHVGTGAATDHALDALRYLAMGDSQVETFAFGSVEW